MLNKVQIIGNLGADPEVRTLNDGAKVTNIRVACTERWKDSAGERREKTEWVRVSLWGDGPANYLQFAQKGTTIYAEGKLETRKYTDNAGVEKYSTEVVVNYKAGGAVKILSGGVDREEEPAQARQTRSRAKTKPAQPAQQDLDDEIPF